MRRYVAANLKKSGSEILSSASMAKAGITPNRTQHSTFCCSTLSRFETSAQVSRRVDKGGLGGWKRARNATFASNPSRTMWIAEACGVYNNISVGRFVGMPAKFRKTMVEQ